MYIDRDELTTLALLVAGCAKHPAYRMRRFPRSTCTTCAQLYAHRHLVEQLCDRYQEMLAMAEAQYAQALAAGRAKQDSYNYPG